MTAFNVGDRVRYGLEDQGTVLTPARKKGGLVVVRFDDGTVNNIREGELSPATDTKALRAKYKASGETPQNKARRVLLGRFPDKREEVEMYLYHLGPYMDDLDDTRRIAHFQAVLAALGY